jgi:hypothetical protein
MVVFSSCSDLLLLLRQRRRSYRTHLQNCLQKGEMTVKKKKNKTVKV